ncbi:SGNH/GDSL hydrolase family protein [Echinicola soli]|uniref:SGNH/GDSL hydrolase family protein n=1 Tax=Echinicola soli TaxID=2591634 RepID=A0A514CN18_9BACT|nr:SGNH/GDSL hydrolase family protein [Echinicola soli]QDH81222.1 SGNH/GDSL hydrolase family protein [Echinicola soli]
MRGTPLLLILGLLCGQLKGQSRLVEQLAKGKDQLVVVYGTSLSSGERGGAWMGEVSRQLNARYDGHLDYILSGKGGMWSTWGVQHLEDSVIAKHPDVVIIEFAINDAFEDYHTPLSVSELNLRYMVDRIKLSDPSCEIILQVMNMPVGTSAEYRPALGSYYQMYRRVARSMGLLLVDHYANWQKILDQGREEFLEYVPDGIHPSNKSGREIIAPKIIETLMGN